MTLDEIVEEVKKDYSPFFEFTWDFLRELCDDFGINFYTDEIENLRWAWNRVLKHECEIQPIMADCEKLLGRRAMDVL